MLKFQRAIFCYYILGFDRGMHAWILLQTMSLRTDGLITIGSDNREKIAKWLTDMFAKKLDFETILHILTGDPFFEKNKNDVNQLERECGRRITELWDTDPIFSRYPNLRTMARNKEFEEMWAKIKVGAKQK